MAQATPETATLLVELRADEPGFHSVRQIRMLDDHETEQIQAASELIRSVGASAEFVRFQDVTKLALTRLDVVESRDRPSQQEIDAAVAAVAAVIEAREKLLGGICRLLSGAMQNLPHEIDPLVNDPSWTVLTGAVEAPSTIVRDRNRVIGVVSEGEFAPLISVAEHAFEVAQSAYIECLCSISDDVLAAGTLLRQLHAEAPEGIPALLEVPDEGSTDDGFTIQPHDLPLDRVSNALRVARRAREVHDEGEDSEKLVISESEGDWDTAPTAEIGEPPIAARADADATATGGAGVEANEQEADNSEASGPRSERAEIHYAEATGGGSGDAEADSTAPVVDVEGVIALAVELNRDLEREWSGALERAANRAGIERQLAAVRGAIAAFQRSYEADTSGEINDRLDAWPLPLDELASITPGSAQDSRWRTRAEIAAFIQVLDALRGLQEPTRIEFRFIRGERQRLETFWEAGAFAILRSRLELLQALVGLRRDDGHPVREPMRRLRLAQASWLRGDPESCMAHAIAGLCTWCGVTVEELPAALSAEVGLQEAGLRECVVAAIGLYRYSQDGGPSLAAATLLARCLADALLMLVQGPETEVRNDPARTWEILAEGLPFSPLREDD